MMPSRKIVQTSGEKGGSSLGAESEAVDERKRAAHDAGRPQAVAAQHNRGRLTARERVERLVDLGSFRELGILARSVSASAAPEIDDAADGVIVGRGMVQGRPVVVVSYDFTVLGGSMGRTNDEKFSRARNVAIRYGIPLLMLLEGGGARVQERMGSTTAKGHERFSDLALLSGWAPIVCGIMGHTYAGHANLAALADFVVMVRNSSLGIAGPRLVEAATGEKATLDELGGPRLHAEKVGSVELAVDTEAEALDAMRTYLSYLPGNATELPRDEPYRSPDDGEMLPDTVLALIPDSETQAYDMQRLVDMVLDADSKFELKPRFARNVITAFGRIGGKSVGLIANNPMFLAGILDTPSSDKMSRFINVCDCFNLPLIFLVDVPGYIVGTRAEETGIVRHSMKPLWELGQSTVPILTVIVRKAYGLAYHTMGGAEFHPEVFVAWPSARISPMGAAGAVNVIYGKEGSNRTDDERKRMYERLKELEKPWDAAEAMKIDDIIDPRETRSLLLEGLAFVGGQPVHARRSIPLKKRGISPL